jgi:hypothetical protein
VCGIFSITLQKRSHRADEYIRLVKDHLELAVEQCIEAAGYEFDTRNQTMLIRVSAYVLNKSIYFCIIITFIYKLICLVQSIIEMQVYVFLCKMRYILLLSGKFHL